MDPGGILGRKVAVLIINIESNPAIESLDELLSVPELDGVLVGPHDLSLSLGVPEQYDHPIFRKAVESVISKARAAGIAAGVHSWLGVEYHIAWAKAGANLIICGGDIDTVRISLRADIDQIRASMGEEKKVRDSNSVRI